MSDEVLHFIAFEESRFRWSHALHRHSRYALADDQHFGCSPGDVLEEAVYGGQALVARAHVVATVGFEMPVELCFRRIHEGEGFISYFWSSGPREVPDFLQ